MNIHTSFENSWCISQIVHHNMNIGWVCYANGRTNKYISHTTSGAHAVENSLKGAWDCLFTSAGARNLNLLLEKEREIVVNLERIWLRERENSRTARSKTIRTRLGTYEKVYMTHRTPLNKVSAGTDLARRDQRGKRRPGNFPVI